MEMYGQGAPDIPGDQRVVRSPNGVMRSVYTAEHSRPVYLPIDKRVHERT